MNEEEINKLFHRIELDKSNDSCGFEFADGFGCTFDNIATCYDDRLKLYDLVKQLQQELTDYKERNEKAIEYIYKNSIPVHLLSDPPKPMLDFEGDINEVLKILDKKDKE